MGLRQFSAVIQAILSRGKYSRSEGRTIVTTVALGPKRKAVGRIFREFRIVKEDLEELVDGFGGLERTRDAFGAIAVTDAHGLVDVDAS